MLDALKKADTNHDGLIWVTDLIGSVDSEVPEISYQAFRLRQIPQAKMMGSNFALADRVDVLPASNNVANAPSIPTTPTHVVFAPADVYKAESATAAVIEKLSPGTEVRLINADHGWDLVAKNGIQLGYVEGEELVRLH